MVLSPSKAAPESPPVPPAINTPNLFPPTSTNASPCIKDLSKLD